jgi:hypothetical protein
LLKEQIVALCVIACLGMLPFHILQEIYLLKEQIVVLG